MSVTTGVTLATVRVAGAEVTCTPREFALLEALARRSPRVVTKAELLDAVWGADRDVDPNAVEVYVGYLRRKLQPHHEPPLIQTVRGLGYMLKA